MSEIPQWRQLIDQAAADLVEVPLDVTNYDVVWDAMLRRARWLGARRVMLLPDDLRRSIPRGGSIGWDPDMHEVDDADDVVRVGPGGEIHPMACAIWRRKSPGQAHAHGFDDTFIARYGMDSDRADEIEEHFIVVEWEDGDDDDGEECLFVRVE